MQQHKMRWGHLIYLGFYFIPPFLQPTSLLQWLGILLLLVVFLIVYLKTESAPLSQRWYWLMGMVLIASLATPLNSGSMTMFAFVGFYIGFWCRGVVYPIALVLLLSWQGYLLWLWWWQPVYWLQAYAAIVTLGVSISGRVEQMRQQHLKQLERSNAELELMATQLERERIARDLHDLMGHSLASIALKAELTEVWLDQQQYSLVKRNLVELQQLARHSLIQVRETITGYRQQGIHVVLPMLLAQLRSNGWQCHIDANFNTFAQHCPEDMELILTELCTNLLKHSNGNQMWLKLDRAGEQWQLQFKDNGDCFAINPGNGLRGISERLQAIGGELQWQLAPTCFKLSWPMVCKQQTSNKESAA